MKILVCTDGSEQADRAVRMGGELAVACQAGVTLLGIKESTGSSDLILGALTRGQQFLESQKVAAEIVTKSGEPIEEIVRRTEETSYDLVVIGAARKGHRGPFSMSAKAYKIIKLIKPPVLIVMGNPTGLKRILICSGGKGYIEAAFGLVGSMAQKTAASICLLHVMAQPPAIYSDFRGFEEDVNLVLNSNSELGRNLRREKEELTALGIDTQVQVRQGFVLDEVFREIRGGHYDLVVAGSTLSAGPLRTYVLGDVTREIVNRANCPVLVARHSIKPPNFKERLRQLFQGFSFSASPAEPVRPH